MQRTSARRGAPARQESLFPPQHSSEARSTLSAGKSALFPAVRPRGERFTDFRYRHMRTLFGPQPERKGFPRRGEEGLLLYWGAAPTPAASACYQHLPPLTASASACRRLPPQPAGRKPVPSPSSASVFPPPASRTFRGYSRLCREITSIPMPKRTKGISCAFLHFMREK